MNVNFNGKEPQAKQDLASDATAAPSCLAPLKSGMV